MSQKTYIVQKLKLSSLRGRTGKKRVNSIIAELQDVVFQDTSKESLTYFLADELANRGYNIEHITLTQV